jgi:hypothetical protein
MWHSKKYNVRSSGTFTGRYILKDNVAKAPKGTIHFANIFADVVLARDA